MQAELCHQAPTHLDKAALVAVAGTGASISIRRWRVSCGTSRKIGTVATPRPAFDVYATARLFEFNRSSATSRLGPRRWQMSRRRRPVRRSCSPGDAATLGAFHAAGVGIGSQNPPLGWISGPVSCHIILQ